MDKKNIVTPKGVLVFPHLKSPDTKFDENGVKLPDLVKPLRHEIPLPSVPMADCNIQAQALCYPALQQYEPRWNVQYLMPWQLIFADLITFDFYVRGNKST